MWPDNNGEGVNGDSIDKRIDEIDEAPTLTREQCEQIAAILTPALSPRKLTACPCGHAPGEPCITDRPAPEGNACCQALDLEQIAAAARRGLTCSSTSCARQQLDEDHQ